MLARTYELLDQRTKVRRLKLIEFSGSIFAWKTPRIWVCAHERAHRLAIAKVDPCHGDDLVDDCRQLTPGLPALDLRLPRCDVEVVDVLFEYRHKNDGASAGVLQLIQPAHHAAAVQSINRSQVLAAAIGERLRLLFRPGETKPTGRGQTVDEEDLVTDELNISTWQPQIEGNKTGRELPAIVDEIVTMQWVDFGDRKPVRAFVCTNPNPWGYPAKDRSGRLEQIEPPNLGALIEKLTGPGRRKAFTIPSPEQSAQT